MLVTTVTLSITIATTYVEGDEQNIPWVLETISYILKKRTSATVISFDPAVAKHVHIYTEFEKTEIAGQQHHGTTARRDDGTRDDGMTRRRNNRTTRRQNEGTSERRNYETTDGRDDERPTYN